MARHVVVKDIDLGLKKIVLEMEQLGKAEILIGIQEGSKTTLDYVRGRKSIPNLNIASYAAKNEFGTPEIPERSFMRSTFDQNIQAIENFVERRYAEIIDQQLSVSQGLGQIGKFLEGAVKDKIREIRTPPNSPRTIKIKKSSKPLIDFGQMFSSVRYVVRVKK